MKLIYLFILLSLTACVSENIIEGEGHVFDAKTKEPLDSVVIKFYIKDGEAKRFKSEMTTDSTGYFYGSTGLVACKKDCPDLLIVLTRQGYTPKEIVNPNKVSVYLNP
jgi:hypothetical protein